MIRHLLFLLAALGLLAGCAHQPRPELTREQWLDTTTRVYPGLTREQVVAAAEKVLRLADGDDFHITHDEAGFHAERSWMAYLLIIAMSGTDYWAFSAADTPAGVKAAVGVSTRSQSITPMQASGGGGGWTPVPGLPMGAAVDGTAIYDVFWARVDYLLGLRPTWMSCAEADARVKARQTWGNNEMLCNSINMADATPAARP